MSLPSSQKIQVAQFNKLRIFYDDLTEDQVSTLEKYDFIEYVPNYSSADVIINSEPRQLKVQINIGDSSDFKESGIIDLLLNLYRGLMPEAYINYLLDKPSNNELFRVLKSLPGDIEGETAHDSFNGKYTTILLQTLRKDYAIKMLNIIKTIIEDMHKGSYDRFLSNYSRSQHTLCTDDHVDGSGIWSPELLHAYVTNYLMWSVPTFVDIYNEYIDLRSNAFLRKQLKVFFRTLPEKLYTQALRDVYLDAVSEDKKE